MAPIRVGIIGLSAESGWAVMAHLPYFQKTSKYKIVALCNSSVDRAKAAIAAHKLPEETKAYGSPQDLAVDPDVDLVVCSVHVTQHFDTIFPSVKAGKDVFCEWPLGATLEEAEKLDAAARESGSRTMIGLQGRGSTLLNKVKTLIAGEKIGKVLSTSYVTAAYNGGLEESEKYAYLAENKGGNIGSIHFGHSIDAILYTLSSELAHFTSIRAIQRPSVTLIDTRIDDPARKPVGTAKRTAPDTILLQGLLTANPPQNSSDPPSVPFTYHMRGGPSFAPGEAIVWSIYGSLGEIKVTSSSVSLHLGTRGETLRIKLHSRAGDTPTTEVETLKVEEDEWDELPGPARNVARLYEAFASGEGYEDWGLALKRHKLIAEMEEREEKGDVGTRAAYVN